MERLAMSDRCKLRLIADKNKPRRFPLDDLRKQRRIHHRRFINDDGIALHRTCGKNILSTAAEKKMNRCRLDSAGFLQPRRGFSCKSAELHRERRISLFDSCDDHFDDRRFSDSGAAVDDRELMSQRKSCRINLAFVRDKFLSGCQRRHIKFDLAFFLRVLQNRLINDFLAGVMRPERHCGIFEKRLQISGFEHGIHLIFDQLIADVREEFLAGIEMTPHVDDC